MKPARHCAMSSGDRIRRIDTSSSSAIVFILARPLPA
jgi:hypothetical protein